MVCLHHHLLQQPHCTTMTATVSGLYRFPVKSLLGESLDTVSLSPEAIFPGDRKFAIVHKTSAWDSTAPDWRPKTDFVNLSRVEKLASLQALLDHDMRPEICRAGKRVVGGDLASSAGRAVIEQFLSAFLGDVANGPFRLAQAGENSLTDVPAPFVSLINIESARCLERMVRQPVDPARFRGNIVLEGLPAWGEFDLIGEEIVIGTARLKVEERIGRCAATDVNPRTARRDLNIVRTLSEALGHTDMGIYASVKQPGTIRLGDTMARLQI